GVRWLCGRCSHAAGTRPICCRHSPGCGYPYARLSRGREPLHCPEGLKSMGRTVFHLSAVLLASALPVFAQAPALQAPATVTAGQSFAIRGGGRGTFYLVGPSHVLKQKVDAGQQIAIAGRDVSTSGTYQAILCSSDDCTNTTVQVLPAAPKRLSFLLHPSRVPVNTPN